MLVENRQFERTLPLFVAPLGVTSLEFRLYVCRQETRVTGLSFGVVCVIIRLAVLVLY